MSTSHRLASAREHPVPAQMGLRRWAGHRPQAGGDGASQDWHRAPDEEAPNRYRTDRARRHTGAEYRYRRGDHELVLSLHGITDLQAEAVAGGEAEFALMIEGPLLVLGYRFGDAVPWAATAPLHWQGLPPEERVVPPEVELTPASFTRLSGTLWITLVEAVAARERRELEWRERAYRGDRPAPRGRRRTVILVDDGLATGSTMRAAVAALRQLGPARIVVAVPTAAPATCDEFCHEADECVCDITPGPFYAVGLWYEDFSQTTDAEVRDLLERSAAPVAAAAGPNEEPMP